MLCIILNILVSISEVTKSEHHNHNKSLSRLEEMSDAPYSIYAVSVKFC